MTSSRQFGHLRVLIGVVRNSHSGHPSYLDEAITAARTISIGKNHDQDESFDHVCMGHLPIPARHLSRFQPRFAAPADVSADAPPNAGAKTITG